MAGLFQSAPSPIKSLAELRVSQRAQLKAFIFRCFLLTERALSSLSLSLSLSLPAPLSAFASLRLVHFCKDFKSVDWPSLPCLIRKKAQVLVLNLHFWLYLFIFVVDYMLDV